MRKDKEKINIPVFVISLKTSVKRREIIKKKLNDLEIPFRFLDAVSGKDLPPYEIKTIQNNCVQLKNIRGYSLMPGEIGCSMSHYQVYKHIAENNYPLSLILEDDAEIDASFRTRLLALTSSNISEKYDLLLLIYSWIYRINNVPAIIRMGTRIKVTDNLYIGKPAVFYWSTIGYLISQKGATLLRNKALPIRMPADMLTGNSQAYGIKLYVTNVPILTHSILKKSEIELRKPVKKPLIIVLLKKILFISPFGKAFFYAMTNIYHKTAGIMWKLGILPLKTYKI